MKIINFRGDLTDNSAKKEALLQTPESIRGLTTAAQRNAVAFTSHVITYILDN